MSIYLFSQPIHSGKTTSLQQFIQHKKDCAGILMPDIEGSRKIFDIATKEVFNIQCTDPFTTSEQIISIGKYHFYCSAFEKANQILLAALTKKQDWFIIDEAGKLELDEKGFYPALQKAIVMYTTNEVTGNLLITVRDSLVADVIVKFKITNYNLIHQLEELV